MAKTKNERKTDSRGIVSAAHILTRTTRSLATKTNGDREKKTNKPKMTTTQIVQSRRRYYIPQTNLIFVFKEDNN